MPVVLLDLCTYIRPYPNHNSNSHPNPSSCDHLSRWRSLVVWGVVVAVVVVAIEEVAVEAMLVTTGAPVVATVVVVANFLTMKMEVGVEVVAVVIMAVMVVMTAMVVMVVIAMVEVAVMTGISS